MISGPSRCGLCPGCVSLYMHNVMYRVSTSTNNVRRLLIFQIMTRQHRNDYTASFLIPSPGPFFPSLSLPLSPIPSVTYTSNFCTLHAVLACFSILYH